MKNTSFESFPRYPKSYGVLYFFSRYLCCKTGKLFYIKCILIAVIITSLIMLYLTTTAMGYWTTYFFSHYQYNMTTGYPLSFVDYTNSADISTNLTNITNTSLTLICHNDQRTGFYGGCFGIGVIVDVVVVILIILFYKTGQMCSNTFPYCYEIAEFLYESDHHVAKYGSFDTLTINSEETVSFLSSEFDSDHLVFETGCRSENDIRIATFPEGSD